MSAISNNPFDLRLSPDLFVIWDYLNKKEIYTFEPYYEKVLSTNYLTSLIWNNVDLKIHFIPTHVYFYNVEAVGKNITFYFDSINRAIKVLQIAPNNCFGATLQGILLMDKHFIFNSVNFPGAWANILTQFVFFGFKCVTKT